MSEDADLTLKNKESAEINIITKNMSDFFLKEYIYICVCVCVCVCPER